MKSEHRHELKTNELADWIVHLPQWAKENYKTIIYIAVLAVVVLGLAIYKQYYRDVAKVKSELEYTRRIGQLPMIKSQVLDAMNKNQDMSHLFLPYADNTLKDAVEQTKNDYSVALAEIKRAEAIRSELHYRLETVSQQDLINRLNQAKEFYSQAMEKAESYPLLKANAKYGIGLCEEELGNIEQAKKIYTQLVTDNQYQGTVAAAQAKDRLAVMDDFQKIVVFKKPLPPAAVPQQPVESPVTNITVPGANEPNG